MVRRRVPVVHQMQEADCAAACVAMVLALHGRPVPLSVLQRELGIGRDGASAAAILQTASRFGMRGRGVRIELDELRALPQGAILHWRFRHFVVFERADARRVVLVDPAAGRRAMSWDQVSRYFTGVALVLEPAAEFTPPERPPSPYWNHLRSVLLGPGPLARATAVSLLLRVFALSLPVLTGLVVDRVVPRSDVDLLLAVGSGSG